ncbi:MAG: lysophospholipid acyltransferase family protein, partial [Pirellulaceae bacterium]
MSASQSSKTVELPKISQPMVNGFRLFNRRFLRKNFHTLSLLERGTNPDDFAPECSVVVYANHASWWDPLLAMYLADSQFSSFRMYAPIDADAFEKYKMFGKMGFYPINQQSLEGAANFLKISRRILQEPGSNIWITPEGRFCDPRDDSAELMPGLAHLATKLMRSTQNQLADSGAPPIAFLPLAVEYAFWEERHPEILLNFGQPTWVEAKHGDLHPAAEPAWDKERWQSELTLRLREAQRQLAESSVARDSSAFTVLLRSSSGTFFVYDWFRKVKGLVSGKQIDVAHSDKL